MEVWLILLFSSAFSLVRASDPPSFSCVRKYFLREKLTDFIVIDSFAAGQSNSAVHSFLRLAHTKSEWSLTVRTNGSKTMDDENKGRQKNVILFVSSPRDIGPDITSIRRTKSRIYIILTNEYLSLDSIQVIFRKFDTFTRRHVVVMHAKSDFWKFYKYVEGTCPSDARESLVVVAECSGNLLGANLRQLSAGSKVKGKSCPLIVAVRQYKPFAYYEDSKGIFGGMDYLIVKTISERLQLNVKFVRAEAYSTAKADIFIGGHARQSPSSEMLIDSQPYYQDDATWCIQKAKLRAKWKLFLLSLDMKSIMIIVGAAAVTSSIFFVSSGYERRPLDFWMAYVLVVQIIAGASSMYKPLRITGRILYFLLLYIGFFSVTLVASFMFTSIANPTYEHQVSTFEEIRAASFCLAAEEEMKKFLISQNMVHL